LWKLGSVQTPWAALFFFESGEMSKHPVLNLSMWVSSAVVSNWKYTWAKRIILCDKKC
jgi:hypothetical protein